MADDLTSSLVAPEGLPAVNIRNQAHEGPYSPKEPLWFGAINPWKISVRERVRARIEAGRDGATEPVARCRSLSRHEDSEQRDRHHDTDTWFRFEGLGSSGSALDAALDAAQPEGLTRTLVSGGGDIDVGGVLVELLGRGQTFGYGSSVRLMSEQEPSVEERDWPKRCPHCETELQTATQGFNPAGEDDIDHGEMGEVLAVDFCPNPDCPGKETDPARASHDQ